jgi:transglutaminase-like putative cysteine protease
MIAGRKQPTDSGLVFFRVNSYLGFALVLAALVALAAPARADAEVRKAPSPGWVEVVDLNAVTAPTGGPRNGISNILADTQFIHRPKGYADYTRYAYKIVERPGLENGARITFSFDPVKHSVSLNQLRIIRNGAVIDKLAEATIEIFRQERDARIGVLNGWLTAYINLSDVRLGDIIDYATTYETRPLVGEKLFYASLALQWEEPLGLLRRRITWPASQPLHVKNFRTVLSPTTTTTGANTSYFWEVRNPEPVLVEQNLPAEFPAWASVQVSSTDRWQDIVDALADHYEPSTELPLAWVAKLDAIAAQDASAEAKMIGALRLVQDEIRYISLAIGVGSYLPRDPAAVVATGFGDCKDKALLLVSALKYLGIQSEIALTDLDAGRALGTALPALEQFDHVVVKARIGRETYWLDATDFLQGGTAANLVQAEYGFGLPVTEGGAKLEEMPSRAMNEPSMFIDEQFSFPRDETEPLRLGVSATYEGGDADAMRRRLAGTSLADLGIQYLQYYNKRYPGLVTTAPPVASDNRDGNVLIVKEFYELPQEALKSSEIAASFPLKAELGNDRFPTPTAVGRKGPIYLGKPVQRRHRMVIRNLKATFLRPDDLNVFSAYFVLWVWSHATPTEFTLDWHLRNLATQVPAEDIAAYLKSVDKLTTNTYLTYNFGYVEQPGQ